MLLVQRVCAVVPSLMRNAETPGLFCGVAFASHWRGLTDTCFCCCCPVPCDWFLLFCTDVL